MPHFSMSGNCYWISGFDEEVDAPTEDLGKDIVLQRFVELEEKARAIGINITDVEFQHVVMREEIGGSIPDPIHEICRKLAERVLNADDDLPYDTAEEALRLLAGRENKSQ
jgi:regulator of protease activity HflC (stomatin/prohibitin superfamily)